MAKFIEQQYNKKPELDQTSPPVEEKEERDETLEFDEYLYETLWDADLDLQLSEHDEAEMNYHYGYITALREVASKFFDYTEDTLDKLSPTYVGFNGNA